MATAFTLAVVSKAVPETRPYLDAFEFVSGWVPLIGDIYSLIYL